MLKNERVWKKGAKLLVWGGVLALCVGMAERKLLSQRCEEIVVNFSSNEAAAFLSKADILDQVNKNGPVLGRKMDLINLAEIENAVRDNKFVKNCEAKKDFSGNLIVEIELHNPIARWVDTPGSSNEWKKARGFYITETGQFIPLSNRYSMHVPLISGEYIRNLKGLDTEKGKPFMELVQFINSHEFWKAQVSQLVVDKDGEVSFFTTLGNQTIEFGPPTNISSKFRKLKIFYDRVLSSDWNAYSKVNVKFQDQVVCE
jgi:cell division protein FtsQ